jgi:hypothetical protein
MKVAGALVKRRPLAQIVAHGSTGSDGQEKATAVLRKIWRKPMINGNSRILKWYLQFRFLKWPLI